MCQNIFEDYQAERSCSCSCMFSIWQVLELVYSHAPIPPSALSPILSSNPIHRDGQLQTLTSTRFLTGPGLIATKIRLYLKANLVVLPRQIFPTPYFHNSYFSSISPCLWKRVTMFPVQCLDKLRLVGKFLTVLQLKGNCHLRERNKWAVRSLVLQFPSTEYHWKFERAFRNPVRIAPNLNIYTRILNWVRHLVTRDDPKYREWFGWKWKTEDWRETRQPEHEFWQLSW